MTRSQRLRPVAAMKQREQLNSARQLSESINELKKQEERLRELKHYRDDYLNKYRQMASTGSSIERIRHYQEFIARLDQSITLQEKRVAERKQHLHEKKESWKQARARSDAFEKVVERYRQEEYQFNEQQKQKEADDQAQHAGHDRNHFHH